MRRVLLMLTLILGFPSAATPQSLEGQLELALDLVANAVERSFARTLPLPAPSAGVSYSFDPASGNFQRDPATLGQVYLQRADPLGAGKWNVSFAYQYAQLDELSGNDAGNLRNQSPIPIPGLLAAFDLSPLDLEVAVHQFLFAASYGITEDLEASIAVPVVYSAIRVDVPIAAAALTPEGELVTLDDRLTDRETSTGIGDVLLRAKYRFASLSNLHLAGGLQLRLPSGSEQSMHGVGYVEVTPSLIASTRIFEAASWARLQGHFNGGIAFDTDDVDNSDARWGIGLDWGITDGVTAAVSFLAQNQFAAIAPPGTFTFPSCQGDLVTCAVDPSVRTGTQQLFGMSTARVDSYTLSIGGRGSVWRDTLFAMVNVAIPLNDGFVRTDPIPLIGLEATF